MTFIFIEQPQRFEERLTFRSREVFAGEGAQEGVGEVERAVAARHLFAQRLELCLSQLPNPTVSRIPMRLV